jgi:hypothetical protein
LKKRVKKRSVSKRQGNPINVTTPSIPGDPYSLAHCDTDITPACIKALYQIPDATRASPTNSLGLFEEQSFAYSQEDLDMFFTSYAPNIPNGTHPTPAFIDGGTAPVAESIADAEADVDLAIPLSLIYPQSVTLYQTDDSAYIFGFTGLNGLFNTFLDALDGVSSHYACSEGILYTDKPLIFLVILHIQRIQHHWKQPWHRPSIPRPSSQRLQWNSHVWTLYTNKRHFNIVRHCRGRPAAQLSPKTVQ